MFKKKKKWIEAHAVIFAIGFFFKNLFSRELGELAQVGQTRA